MPIPKVHRNVVDQQGNIVTGVLGSVYNQGTGVLAALYQDDAGTVPLSNPMTNDPTYGSFKFYIAPGHYDFTFTKPGYTFEPVDDFQVPEDTVTLGSMATQHANAVTITGGTISNVTLPLGSMATQNASAVAITGGTALGLAQLSATLIGAGTAPNAPYALAVNGNTQFAGGNLTHTGTITAAQVDATNMTVSSQLQATRIGAGVTPNPSYALAVSGAQSFSGGNLTHTGTITAAQVDVTNLNVASLLAFPGTQGVKLLLYNAGSAPTLTRVGFSIASLALQMYVQPSAVMDFGVLDGSGGFTSQMRFEPSNQRLGIGVFPAYGLHVSSNAGVPGGAWINSTSSRRLKQAIRPLGDALALLTQLQPRLWEWRAEETTLATHLPGTQAGFVAEEVGQVQPQWQVEGGLAMRGLEAYLVRAVQQLLARVEGLEVSASGA